MSDSNKHSETPSARERPSPWSFRLLIELPAGILVFIVTVVITTVLTPLGRELASNTALQYLKLPPGYSLQIETLRSPSIGQWTFNELILLRENQPLLSIQNGVVDWTPFQILLGHFRLSQISSSEMHVYLSHFQNTTQSDTEKQLAILEHTDSIEDRLRALDKKIDSQLKQMSLRFLPVKISQFRINELNLHNKTQTTKAKINGTMNLATDKKIAKITLSTELLSHPVGLQIRTEGALDYKRNLLLNIQGGWFTKLGDKPLQSHAGIQIESRLHRGPLKLEIKPSTLTLNGEIIHLAGSAVIAPDLLEIDELQFKALKGQGNLKGTVVKKSLDLTFNFMQLDPSHFFGSHNQFITSGSLHLTGQPGDLQTKGNIAVSGSLQQEKIQAQTDLVFKNNRLNFNNTLIQLEDAKASADGFFDLQQKFVSVNAWTQNLKLSQLQSFKIKIPPTVDLEIQEGTTQIQFQFPKPNTPPTLSLSAKGQFNGSVVSIPGKINGDLYLDLDHIKIHSADIQIEDSHLQGFGSLNWRKKTIDLQFTGQDITPSTLHWLPFAIPLDVDGSLQSDIQLQGQLRQPTITVSAQGPIVFRDLKLFTRCNINTNLKKLHIEFCDFFDPATTHNTLDKNTPKLMSHSGELNFTPLTIDLKHELFLLPFASLVKASPLVSNVRNQLELEGKFQGVIKTKFARSSQSEAIQFQKATADIGFFGNAWGEPLFGGLRAQTNRTKQGFALRVESLGLDYGSESYLTLQSTADHKTIQFQLDGLARSKDFKQLPFSSLDPFTQWPATLRAKTTAQGDLKEPNIRGAIEYIADIQQVNSLGKSVIVPLKLLGTFTQPKNQPLSLDARVYKKNQVQSEFNLETNALSRELAHIFTQTKRTPLKITSQGQMNLGNLNLFLSPVFHQFKGLAFWDGHWDSGLSGQLEINNGEYEHLTLGTHLEKIELGLKFNEGILSIQEGRATDGNEGRYVLAGTLNPQDLSLDSTIPHLQQESAPSKDPTSSKQTLLTLNLDQVKLIDRPDVETLAKGLITLAPTQGHTKATNPLTLTGDLKLQPLEIQLDRTQSNEIPELDVIQYNPRFNRQSNTEKTNIPIALNVNLTTDQQAFLRGKGINAELQGNISVKGSLKEPRMSGFFKTIRGNADILGKRFTIRTGELRFDDYRGLLNIEATHSKLDQEFTARVTGSVENLDVRLESDPPLPEDETLSQLLFGKALDDISAVQALRIASAVRSFSTQGAGLDPIASTRDLLGVDQITLDSENSDDGNENYKLGVGKYISDRVYVEIQRSSNPAEPWQGQVQIELTPNISLETSAESNDGVSGVDLNWKRDY